MSRKEQLTVNKKQRRWRNRILVAIALFFAIMLAEKLGLWNALFGSYATYGVPQSIFA